VLDEPTAAIDPLSEVDIVRRLLALGRNGTAVVVSHRLGIARAADRILVLEAGRIVEEGSHAALMERNGLYARMWRAQASWYQLPHPEAEPKGSAP
jgi:ATP-binding cassette subfamily B protein